MTFKREERYYVLKISDMRKYLSREKFESVGAIAEKLNAGRAVDGKTVLQAVVVEHDWPEYEGVWQMIETRVKHAALNPNNDRRFWPIGSPSAEIVSPAVMKAHSAFHLPVTQIQEVKQVPVAFVRFKNGMVDYDADAVISNTPSDCMDESIEWHPVYATPHKAISMTREEFEALVKHIKANFEEKNDRVIHINAERQMKYHMALSELVDKITGGLDSGDLFADAVAASKLLDLKLAQTDHEPCGEAYLCNSCKTPFDGAFQCPSCGHGCATKEPVYTTPPQSKKLEHEAVAVVSYETFSSFVGSTQTAAGINFLGDAIPNKTTLYKAPQQYKSLTLSEINDWIDRRLKACGPSGVTDIRAFAEECISFGDAHHIKGQV